jgi:hypothetical protein
MFTYGTKNHQPRCCTHGANVPKERPPAAPDIDYGASGSRQRNDQKSGEQQCAGELAQFDALGLGEAITKEGDGCGEGNFRPVEGLVFSVRIFQRCDSK